MTRLLSITWVDLLDTAVAGVIFALMWWALIMPDDFGRSGFAGRAVAFQAEPVPVSSADAASIPFASGETK